MFPPPAVVAAGTENYQNNKKGRDACLDEDTDKYEEAI